MNKRIVWALLVFATGVGLSLGAVFFAEPAAAEAGGWLDFVDETDTRLVLSTVPDNDSEEKDIAVGDLNNDGWPDLVVVRKAPFSNPGGRADLLLINDNGVLTDMTATHAPEFQTRLTDSRDVIILDFDKDGWEDVVIVNTFQDQPVFYHNNGEDVNGDWLGLTDESATRFPFIDIEVLQDCAGWGGDVTGDGFPDIYFSNYDPNGVSLDVLLVNDGNGNFTDETEARLGDLRNSAFGTSVEIHDVDNDGDNDIVKISTLFHVPPWDDNGVFILFNDGTGNFTNWQKADSDAPYMFTVGDVNSDGLLDIYVVDDQQDYVDIATGVLTDTVVTFTQNILTNSPRTASFGGNVKLADLDNDTDLDLAIADVDVDIPPCESGGGSNRKYTMLQNGGVASGVLEDPWGLAINPWTVSTFDLGLLDVNRDGAMDFVLGRCSEYDVFINTTPGLAMTHTVAVTNVTVFGGSDGMVDLSVTGGLPPYEYDWSNGATTEDLVNVPAGTYTATVTDSRWGLQIVVVTVLQPDPPASFDLFIPFTAHEPPAAAPVRDE